MTGAREYYNGFLPRFVHDDIHGNPRHKTALKRLNVIVKDTDRVLDIGCGVGTTSRNLSAMGARVTGIDIADELIEYAKRQNSHYGLVEYICADVTKVELSGKFDVIAMVDVLEHIPMENLSLLFKNLMEWSHSGTTFYVNWPDGRFIDFMRDHYRDKLQEIDNSIDPWHIMWEFSSRGFECIEWSAYGIDVPMQYNQAVFISKDRLNNAYRNGLKQIYRDTKELAPGEEVNGKRL